MIVKLYRTEKKYFKSGWKRMAETPPCRMSLHTNFKPPHMPFNPKFHFPHHPGHRKETSHSIHKWYGLYYHVWGVKCDRCGVTSSGVWTSDSRGRKQTHSHNGKYISYFHSNCRTPVYGIYLFCLHIWVSFMRFLINESVQKWRFSSDLALAYYNT